MLPRWLPARGAWCTSADVREGPTLGKGDVLWRSVAVSTGDIIVWLDLSGSRDQPAPRPSLVLNDMCSCGRLRPGTLVDMSGEGGRVTELVARPVISALFPQRARTSTTEASTPSVARWRRL